MREGRIIKAISGFYYVHLHDEPSESIIQCRARGVFKKRNISPLVGDLVKIELTENEEGTVVEVLPRRSELIRPPIANVDQAVMVFAVTSPAFSYPLLDRLLVHAEFSGIDGVICLTKMDDPEEKTVEVQELKEIYEPMGYPVLFTSAKSGQGMDELLRAMSGKINVLAGPSGVGKSTLLNRLMPELDLKTGDISTKLGRGKHTTRHVELIQLPDQGAVADTPGFSQLDFPDMAPEQLSDGFVEMRKFSPSCKFRGCLHQEEPGCTVREALSSGTIASTRFENYTTFLQEIKNSRRY